MLIEVTPGTSKVRAGSPVTITARLRGLDAGLVPELTYGGGDDAGSVRMTPNADGTFSVTFDEVTASFPYAVEAGPARSDAYDIEVIRPPRVTRIDVRYRYPEGLGLEPRVEEDGGDIYGPAGTTVELTVATDKPIARGALTMADGTSLALSGRENVLEASMAIRADGAYRVALTDVDGLENTGDTEYFIRMLNDRPPDVRVLRPGGDKQVTPARGSRHRGAGGGRLRTVALELVFQAPGKKDTVVPFPAGRQLVGDWEPHGAARGPRRRARRLRHLLCACARRRAGAARHRDAQRHLLPRGEAVRGRVRGGAEPGHGHAGAARGCRTWPRRRRRSSRPRGSWTRARGAPAQWQARQPTSRPWPRRSPTCGPARRSRQAR